MMMNDEELNKEADSGKSESAFYILFAIQLILIAIGMFMPIQMGLTTLPLFTLLAIITLIRCNSRQLNKGQGNNIMVHLFICLGIFCTLEMFNNNHVQSAWNIAITHYFFYPTVCAFLVPIAIRNYKGVEILLIIWSLFVLMASFKGYWQKNHGFNSQELYFLYNLGGYRTHIIWSGIRYFSCFSDAANYGVHAAMAATTFGIAAAFIRKRLMKIYFILVALCAIYSVAISGTRAAVAVPLGGILLYIIISKSRKGFAISSILLIAAFSFSTSHILVMEMPTSERCVQLSALTRMLPT